MTTLEELEKRIAAQEDLRAIERLQANYWDYLDAKNWEGLRSILIEDFVFINNTTGGRYEGRDGMLSTMEGKFCDGVISSHQGHHHWVELVDETHAISHWSLEDDLYDSKHGGEFVGRAHYDNKYVKIEVVPKRLRTEVAYGPGRINEGAQPYHTNYGYIHTARASYITLAQPSG